MLIYNDLASQRYWIGDLHEIYPYLSDDLTSFSGRVLKRCNRTTNHWETQGESPGYTVVAQCCTSHGCTVNIDEHRWRTLKNLISIQACGLESSAEKAIYAAWQALNSAKYQDSSELWTSWQRDANTAQFIGELSLNIGFGLVTQLLLWCVDSVLMERICLGSILHK